MSPEFRVSSPRIEVSEGLPFISSDPAVRMLHDGVIAADQIAAASIAALRSADGPLAKAVLAMLGDGVTSALTTFATLCADQDAGTPDGLYALATRLDGAGQIQDAVVILAVLAGNPAGERHGVLGLSVIATRLERMDVALDLVTASLADTERHPRACSIAGICALERGDKAAAQSYLATAARLARQRPDYRPELQIAQRALLLMHLS